MFKFRKAGEIMTMVEIMTSVSKCDVIDCSYNVDRKCHTPAITVGDDQNPRCDTFCHSMQKGGDHNIVASVGACKVQSCKYNRNLECQAGEISVGYQGDEPECTTFRPR